MIYHDAVVYLAFGLWALVLTLILTPLARQVAYNLGALDQGAGRRVYDGVVPRLGCAGIFLAVAAFSIAAIALARKAEPTISSKSPESSPVAWSSFSSAAWTTFSVPLSGKTRREDRSLREVRAVLRRAIMKRVDDVKEKASLIRRRKKFGDNRTS